MHNPRRTGEQPQYNRNTTEIEPDNNAAPRYLLLRRK
jgi:hypothetical protein